MENQNTENTKHASSGERSNTDLCSLDVIIEAGQLASTIKHLSENRKCVYRTEIDIEHLEWQIADMRAAIKSIPNYPEIQDLDFEESLSRLQLQPKSESEEVMKKAFRLAKVRERAANRSIATANRAVMCARAVTIIVIFGCAIWVSSQ